MANLTTQISPDPFLGRSPRLRVSERARAGLSESPWSKSRRSRVAELSSVPGALNAHRPWIFRARCCIQPLLEPIIAGCGDGMGGGGVSLAGVSGCLFRSGRWVLHVSGTHALRQELRPHDLENSIEPEHSGAIMVRRSVRGVCFTERRECVEGGTRRHAWISPRPDRACVLLQLIPGAPRAPPLCADQSPARKAGGRATGVIGATERDPVQAVERLGAKASRRYEP